MFRDEAHYSNIINPVRKIDAMVELLNGSTIIDKYKNTDDLISFDIERVGESKFFGYGICQRLNIKLIDTNREKEITSANAFDVSLGINRNRFLYNYPTFYVSEVNRDENTNELSITAYDLIAQAAKHTVSELNIYSYTILEFAEACAALLGSSAVNLINVNDNSFNTLYENGANFDGSETIREALDAVSEATQTIYYLDAENALNFKRLDISGNAVEVIDKNKYFDLDSKTNRRLSAIIHATELGDNVSVSMTESGSTQYVRDNPFWDLREDIDTLLDNALAAVGGLTINQFEMEWRGNYLIDIGDKIGLTTKDNKTVFSYLLDDKLSYNGSLTQETRWSYEAEEETESNSNNLGDALKKTFARVDKANKQIELVASEVSATKESIASLRMNTDSISASVSGLKDNTSEAIESINGDIATIKEKVEATITQDQVKLEIQEEMSKGANKVITSTGFTFDDIGLTVEKTNSEMKTTITEDGMQVFKNDDAVLTANNVGVNALNLHATTYLIIGNNSRFEDYGSDRTGCFWIGG